jgi:hypothetical protein
VSGRLAAWPRYFQPRPSDAGTGYVGTDSSASNLGPSNPLLIGFVPGVNTVGLEGKPPKTNPFATPADPACVPLDPSGTPVTSPAPGQKYARNRDGSYVCDPDTIPERAIAYRQFNGLWRREQAARPGNADVAVALDFHD